MYEIEYQSGVTGEKIGLDGPDLFLGYAEDLHTSEWGYELGTRTLGSITRKAREGKLTLQSVSDDAVDRFRRIADVDVLQNQPGKIIYRSGLFQRCLIPKTEVSEIAGRFKTIDLTVDWLDGVWRRPVDHSYNPQVSTLDTEWLDYPHPYPYDYAASVLASSVTSGSLLPSAFSLRIFGAATNPSILIGTNHYKLNSLTVPSGGYLTIDSLEKTITLTSEQGDTTNQFGAGERGTGLDSGIYIFQPISPGGTPVSWDGSFGFDLTVYEEEAAPEWSQTSSSPIPMA